MHRRSSGKVPKVEEGISDSEEGLQVKVQSLEKTLNTFRAEVDMKMKIMEQILTTRNEQFAVQKKLLEREHALYQTVLGHWRNTGELAAKGLSLHFSQDVDTLNDDEMDPDEDDLLGSKTSSTAARRARRKRLRAKRLRTELQQPKKLCGDDVDVQLIFSEDEDQRMEVDVKGCGGSDDDYDPSGDGLERKVFVNYYAEEGGKRGEKSSNPVWSYFLREETGKSALCKLCDDGGVQKIIKTHDSSTSPLRRHLKIKHKIECGGGPVSEPRSVASKSSRMSTPVTGSCVYSEVFTAEDWAEIWDYEIKVFKPKWTMAMTNIIRNQGYPCNFKPSHVGIKENGGQPFIRLSGGCNVNRGKCVCKSRYKLTVFNQPERGQEVKISLEANGSYDHSEIPVAVSDEKETTVDVSAEDWEKVWDYDKMTFKQSWTIFMSTLFREQGLLCVYKPSQTIVSEGNEPFLMTHGGCSVSNDNCKARFKITVLEPPIDKEGVKVNIRIRGTQSHSQIITSELTITDV